MAIGWPQQHRVTRRSTGPLKEYYATYTRSKRFTKKETFSVFNFFRLLRVYSRYPVLTCLVARWMEHTHQSETPGSNRQYLPPDFNVRVSGMAGRKWKWNAVPWMSQQLAIALQSCKPHHIKFIYGTKRGGATSKSSVCWMVGSATGTLDIRILSRTICKQDKLTKQIANRTMVLF